MQPGSDGAFPRVELRNEFSLVTVWVDGRGNDPRLAVTDPDTGATLHLDPTELAALANCSHDDLAAIVDPGKHLRFPDPDPADRG